MKHKMKKRVLVTLIIAMMVVSNFAFLNVVDAQSALKKVWTTSQGYGSAEVNPNNNITTLMGNNQPDEYNRHVGPYTKSNMETFAYDGTISFDVNVKIEPSSMAEGESFEVTAALNNSRADTYVTELRVLFKKVGNVVKVTPAAPIYAFEYDLSTSGIYTLNWIYTKNLTTQKIECDFSIHEGDTTLMHSEISDIDIILGVIPAYENADAGRYLWFANIDVDAGLNVYHTLPSNVVQQPDIDSSTVLDKDAIADAIISAGQSAKVELKLTDSVEEVLLPKDVFEKAQEEGKELVVEMNSSDGKPSYSWYFDGSTSNLDVNLVVKQSSVKDMAGIKDIVKEGMVLDFKHSGLLPTGTKIKMNVASNFKTGDKVSVSYYNEITKKLEETKDYVVDSEGNILAQISHCSKYVVEKTKVANARTTDKAPSTGDTSNVARWMFLVGLSGCIIVIAKRKVNK